MNDDNNDVYIIDQERKKKRNAIHVYNEISIDTNAIVGEWVSDV